MALRDPLLMAPIIELKFRRIDNYVVLERIENNKVVGTARMPNSGNNLPRWQTVIGASVGSTRGPESSRGMHLLLLLAMSRFREQTNQCAVETQWVDLSLLRGFLPWKQGDLGDAVRKWSHPKCIDSLIEYRPKPKREGKAAASKARYRSDVHVSFEPSLDVAVSEADADTALVKSLDGWLTGKPPAVRRELSELLRVRQDASRRAPNVLRAFYDGHVEAPYRLFSYYIDHVEIRSAQLTRSDWLGLTIPAAEVFFWFDGGDQVAPSDDLVTELRDGCLRAGLHDPAILRASAYPTYRLRSLEASEARLDAHFSVVPEFRDARLHRTPVVEDELALRILEKPSMLDPAELARVLTTRRAILPDSAAFANHEARTVIGGVNVMIALEIEELWYVLYSKRSHTVADNPGTWQLLPRGFHDPLGIDTSEEDNDLILTIAREMLEELFGADEKVGSLIQDIPEALAQRGALATFIRTLPIFITAVSYALSTGNYQLSILLELSSERYAKLRNVSEAWTSHFEKKAPLQLWRENYESETGSIDVLPMNRKKLTAALSDQLISKGETRGWADGCTLTLLEGVRLMHSRHPNKVPSLESLGVRR